MILYDFGHLIMSSCFIAYILGWTLLHCCACRGQAQHARLLVRLSASPFQRDAKGRNVGHPRSLPTTYTTSSVKKNQPLSLYMHVYIYVYIIFMSYYLYVCRCDRFV